MSLRFADPDSPAIPLHVVPEDGLDDWLAGQSAGVAAWVRATGFTGTLARALVVPDASGVVALALAGYGTPATRARGRFHLAACAATLPEGTYRLHGLPHEHAETEALGWLLSHYAYERYRAQSPAKARLIAPEGVDTPRLEIIAAAEALTRDLINTPANDLGPDALEAACTAVASQHGAGISFIRGADLLHRNFPLIHTVGRAASEEPRLIDMRWGDNGPKLTLVGKGVCFDTGGLNLKPASGMGLMKKDMGGAATVLGLAHMIMALGLPVQLRMLIPAVENSVGSDAFRPGDILTARNGLTVEINNTDAEGRLVLADALACAAEDAPDLMISMATLTGAARVALGPDLAPYYTGDAQFATALDAAAARVADPVWRMPFHTPYETMIEPGIADLDNAPSGGMAGSITAALFLRRFTAGLPYAHFDIYGWIPMAAPARPKGGVGMGARALLAALPEVLNL
ncbi:leucyl aminopeptidase [Roseovarius azorensis]|uniref:Leucyl aminopeptidase n=1 Tax=Roseovarius azorensis TaxID=1287727 RepID=A0A1H7JTY6_9RHOB|nr:leucyl aminopeptidase family protein [Roseovarius azorensis]SEK77520.1 leucyl aminopeptidase [Roseovarius azorensis]